MKVTPSGMATDARELLAAWNAEFPMEVTPSGMVTEVQKAAPRERVIPDGGDAMRMVTDVRELLP